MLRLSGLDGFVGHTVIFFYNLRYYGLIEYCFWLLGVRIKIVKNHCFGGKLMKFRSSENDQGLIETTDKKKLETPLAATIRHEMK